MKRCGPLALQHCASVRARTKGLCPSLLWTGSERTGRWLRTARGSDGQGCPRERRSGPGSTNFTDLSNPSRTFDVDILTLARRSASPCTERLRALPRQRSPRCYRRGRGYLEDGVPHAEALSPANRFSPIRRGACPTRSVEEPALVVSALATTQQASPM